MNSFVRVTLLLLCLTGTTANAAPAPDVLTLEEAAALLRTDAETVELMARAQTIPGRRFNLGDGRQGPWRFSREALMAWLELRVARNETTLSPELEASTRSFEAADRARREAAQQAMNNQPERIEGAIGQRPRGHTATEMFLRDQSVLLGKNEFSLDAGFFYTRRDSQVVVNVPAATTANVESRTATAQGVARYSIGGQTELYARATGSRQVGKVFLPGNADETTTHNTRGDIDLGIRRVVVEEAIGRPEVILGLEAQVPTGQTSPALTGSASLLKSLDPVVLFGSLSYKYTDSRNFSDITLLEPEHTTTLNFGYAFALNDRLSLNTSVSTSFFSETRFDNALLRENDLSSLQFGLTTRVAPGVYLQPSVAFGLNGTGNAFTMGLNVPMNFGPEGGESR